MIILLFQTHLISPWNEEKKKRNFNSLIVCSNYQKTKSIFSFKLDLVVVIKTSEQKLTSLGPTSSILLFVLLKFVKIIERWSTHRNSSSVLWSNTKSKRENNSPRTVVSYGTLRVIFFEWSHNCWIWKTEIDGSSCRKNRKELQIIYVTISAKAFQFI